MLSCTLATRSASAGRAGRTLTSLRDHFAEVAAEHRDEVSKLRHVGLALVSSAIAKADRAMDIVIEGQARLLARPELVSPEHLRDLMRALEDRERLVMLLDRALASNRVQVFLGNETSESGELPVSVVAAPYEEDGRPGGAVGVLGPTRMPYEKVATIVEHASRLLGKLTAPITTKDVTLH